MQPRKGIGGQAKSMTKDQRAQAEARRLEDPTCTCGCGKHVTQGKARVTRLGRMVHRKCAKAGR